MSDFELHSKPPGLLVSVRNSTEAVDALAGGADVIDVKEPDNGALGAADARTIDEIVKVIKGRAPVTAAMGELCDIADTNHAEHLELLPAGVSLFKTGLAGYGKIAGWQSLWRDLIWRVARQSTGVRPLPVAVVYADWQAANAPPPQDVLLTGVEFGCPALLVDTWNKSAGSLFDHWSAEDLQDLINRARSQQLLVVLAGSLSGPLIERAAQLRPDLVAVRGAACDDGRSGVVSAARVRDLKQSVAQYESFSSVR